MEPKKDTSGEILAQKKHWSRRIKLWTAYLLVLLIIALSPALFHLRPHQLPTRQHPEQIVYPWSSELSGWHEASTPYTTSNTSDFLPLEENFVFAVHHSAMIEPDGLTLALFRPHHAVDASGRVRVLQPLHFAGLAHAARRTAELASARKDNGWPLHTEVTCQTLHSLYVADHENETLRYAWVDAYHDGMRELEGGGLLEEEAAEFWGLAMEGFEDYSPWKKADEDVWVHAKRLKPYWEADSYILNDVDKR